MDHDQQKIVFIFPGQGSQQPGMALDLYQRYNFVRRLFTRASAAAGIDFPKLLFDMAAEKLQRTVNTQLAVLLSNQAHYLACCHRGLRPALVMGHSLGEYSALIAAGVFTLEQAVEVVSRRATAMERCTRSFGGGNGKIFMAAVVSRRPLDLEHLRRLCAEASGRGREVKIANDNSPFQVVLAGSHDALQTVCRRLQAEKTARPLPLKVAGAFHSSLMAYAEDEMRLLLCDRQLREPRLPLIANLTADYIKNAEEVRRLMPQQVTGTVRWREAVERALRDGFRHFLECGHGRTLTTILLQARQAGGLYAKIEIARP